MELSSHSGDFASVTTALANAGRLLYERGWVLGTAGNFSAVLSRKPLRLVITGSGLQKGELEQKDFLVVNESEEVLEGIGKPSAETTLHFVIAQARGANAVLHTHSVWATIISELHAVNGGFALIGYEMLKGLAGVATHEHHEWIPILENTQDYSTLQRQMANVLANMPDVHGVLLRRHGLYTWGRDISEARRHVEIFEFLFEVAGRLALNTGR